MNGRNRLGVVLLVSLTLLACTAPVVTPEATPAATPFSAPETATETEEQVIPELCSGCSWALLEGQLVALGGQVTAQSYYYVPAGVDTSQIAEAITVYAVKGAELVLGGALVPVGVVITAIETATYAITGGLMDSIQGPTTLAINNNVWVTLDRSTLTMDIISLMTAGEARSMQQAAEGDQADIQNRRGGSRSSIALIDDNATMARSMVGFIAELMGASVTHFFDCNVPNPEAFDVFIVDHDLGGGRWGTDCVRWLREATMGKVPQPLIIGYSMREVNQEFMNAGADDFWLKGTDPMGLIHKLMWNP